MKLEHLVGVNNEIFPSPPAQVTAKIARNRKREKNEENPLISVDLFTFARNKKTNNDDEKN
jgi:hypothetical protein